MKNLLTIMIVSMLSQSLFAGPFIAGGNGVMSLAYCSTDDGDFGADVSKDINGNVFGFSWVTNQETSPVASVIISPAVAPGTPNEKPMIFRGKDFQIRIFMGNLPAEVGAPIFRGGEVRIKKDKKWLSKFVPCTLFGIDNI